VSLQRVDVDDFVDVDSELSPKSRHVGGGRKNTAFVQHFSFLQVGLVKGKYSSVN
jgi:hypothetical protein